MVDCDVMGSIRERAGTADNIRCRTALPLDMGRRRLGVVVNCFMAVATIVGALFPSQSHAQTSYYWNGGNAAASPANGGTGTWNTTNVNWRQATDTGAAVAWPGTSSGADSGVFAGTAGTVTLSGSLTANALSFTASGYTLTGGTLGLDGTSPSLSVTSGTVTLSSRLAGSGTTKKSGAGTLILSASNMFTGNMVIDAGIVRGSTNSAFGSASNSRTLTINNSSAMEFNVNGMYGGAASTTVPAVVVNAGGILRNTSGNNPLNNLTLNDGTVTATASNNSTNWKSWNINGSITSTGNSLIEPGTAPNPGIILQSSSQSVANSNTNVNVTSGTLTISAPIGNGRGGVPNYNELTSILTKSGAGRLVLSGTNTYSGTSTINAGTLQIGGNGTTGSLNTSSVITGSAGGTIAFNRTNLVSQGTDFSHSIGGGIGLSQLGSGTLSLSGSNTYTGPTTVGAGVLRFNALAAGSGTQSLGSGSAVNLGVAGTSNGELEYNGAGGTLDKNVFALGSGRNRIRNSGAGTLTLSGTLTKDGTILELASGTFNVTSQITGGSQNSDLYVNGASVTLTNTNNDYNGPTYVYNGGTLTLGNSNVIPSGSILTLGGTGGGDTGTGTLAVGSLFDSIGGLGFGSGGGTVRMTASGTAGSAQLTASTGTIALAGGTLDLTGSGTASGLYRLISAQSVTGNFSSITGTSAAYQVLTTSSSVNYQQRAVLGAMSVTNPAAAVITGGSAAFSYTVANNALSGGADLAFSSGSLSASLAGASSGTAAAGGSSGAISGLVFTGALVGNNQQGTFTVTAPDAFGSTTATGTVSVTVLDHATSSLAGALLTSTTVSLGTYNYATNTWESGGDSALFSIYNLASSFGAGLTADLSLLGVTGAANGFTTNLLSTYADIAGGSSQQFSISFDPTGLNTSTTRSTTFTITMSDKTGMAGATASNTLYVTGSVIIVPEPGALALAGIGIVAVTWAARRRK